MCVGRYGVRTREDFCRTVWAAACAVMLVKALTSRSMSSGLRIFDFALGSRSFMIDLNLIQSAARWLSLVRVAFIVGGVAGRSYI